VAIVSPDLLLDEYDAATEIINRLVNEANSSSVMQGNVWLSMQNASAPIPDSKLPPALLTRFYDAVICSGQRSAVHGSVQTSARRG